MFFCCQGLVEWLGIPILEPGKDKNDITQVVQTTSGQGMGQQVQIWVYMTAKYIVLTDCITLISDNFYLYHQI